MKQYKYQLHDVALYDYQYIQRHLTEMAAKGWQLDRITTMGVWRYHRAEPAQIRYEVTYAPTASAYNSRPTAQEEALTDICAEAGWEKVATLAQLHIYCNADPNATPLETDELSRIQTLRKAMNRHLIPQHLLMAVLFAIQLWTHCSLLFRYPGNTLSSALMIGNLVMMSLMILIYIIMIAGYLHWAHRAELAVRDGLRVPECVFYRRFRFVLWLGLAAYLALILMGSDHLMVGGILLLAALMMISVSFTIDLCKELGAPRWVNMVVPFLACLLVLMVFTPGIFGIMDSTPVSDEPEVPNDVPMRLTDLLDTEAEPITITYEESASPIASRIRLWQEAGDSNLELYYSIIDTNLGFAYDMCLNEAEQNFMESASWVSNGVISLNQGDLWGAEYARQAPGDHNDRWLICWEGRIVSLRTSWPLTDQQIAAAAEILKP